VRVFYFNLCGNITHSIICLLKKFLYALPKDCVCLWIFHVSSPVELFLYALPKDCVCLWIFRWSYFFIHCLRTALPKDCVCLWIFHVSNPVELFFEVKHIKNQKKINCVKIKNLKLELTRFFLMPSSGFVENVVMFSYTCLYWWFDLLLMDFFLFTFSLYYLLKTTYWSFLLLVFQY
jgi:hypothetical protein